MNKTTSSVQTESEATKIEPKMTIKSLLACSKCGYEPLNKADLNQHWFFEHTD